MIFIILSTLLFVILSGLFGFKKDGSGAVLIFFIILEIVDFIKYGFTGSLVVISIWNFIVLIAIINGITKGKGEIYLAKKYDEMQENEK
jgi:hypothetical protein